MMGTASTSRPPAPSRTPAGSTGTSSPRRSGARCSGLSPCWPRPGPGLVLALHPDLRTGPPRPGTSGTLQCFPTNTVYCAPARRCRQYLSGWSQPGCATPSSGGTTRCTARPPGQARAPACWPRPTSCTTCPGRARSGPSSPCSGARLARPACTTGRARPWRGPTARPRSSGSTSPDTGAVPAGHLRSLL